MRGSIAKKCTRRCRQAGRKCSSRCTRYYWRLDAPPGPDGQRRQAWSHGFATRKAAEADLREELARRDQGIMLDTAKVTVAAYTDRFLDHLAAIGRDARTVERYGELLRGHVLPTLGGVQLRQLQPGHLKALYAALLRDGRRDGRPGGLSPRTVVHVHRAVHRMLKEAVRDQLAARNVAADLELPPVVEAEMVTLDHDQARRLLASVEAPATPPWLRLLIVLGLALGCRRGELLALRWAEVDLDAGTVRVGRSLRIVAKRLQVKGPKTEAGYRTLALPAFAAAALRRHRTAQAELRLAMGGAYDTAADLILALENGRLVRPDYASTAFRELVHRAGLPAAVHVHTLRHSAASFLAAAGVHPSEIAAQLGHADGGALAMRVYVHPLEDAKRRTAAHLDRAIGGGE